MSARSSPDAPSAPGPSSVRGHLPGLDGVRGLAILVVLVHNVGYFDAVPDSLALKAIRIGVGTGWAGVQLFFVLSGFLITGILLDTRHDAHYFRSFYIRRVLRIFPLYYLTLAGAFLVLPHVVDLGAWGADARRVQVWYWTYLMNWTDPFTGTLPGLSHFWSLAVEEQFYLVWPLVVFALSTDRLMRTCGALVVSALLVRIVMVAWQAPVMATYDFTIARWDALACGAMIALALRTPRWYGPLARWLRPAAVTSLAILLLQMVIDRGLSWFSPLAQTIGYSALALVFGCLILEVVDPSRPAGRLRRLCEARVLRFFGKYSYGMYVLHWPIHRLGQVWLTGWVLGGTPTTRPARLVAYIVANLVVSTAAALVAWHLVERRFLALKDVWGRRS